MSDEHPIERRVAGRPWARERETASEPPRTISPEDHEHEWEIAEALGRVERCSCGALRRPDSARRER